MVSQFQNLSEQDKKMLVAKIIHNINYSQTAYKIIEGLVKHWDEYPVRHANFFKNTNKLNNYGTANN